MHLNSRVSDRKYAIQQPNHDYGYNSVITHQQAPAAVTFNCMLELACVYQ